MKLLSFWKSTQNIICSPISGQISVGKTYGHKTLFVQNIPQSGGEYVFMWNKIIKQLKKENHPISKCLVLGLGGGTVLKSITSQYPNVVIIAVEIDPEIVTIAKKHFELDNQYNLKIIIANACEWVKKAKHKQSFDLIVVDLYIADSNPDCSRTLQFLLHLKNLLEKSGVILYNSHFQNNNPFEFQDFKKLSSSIFSNVEELFSYPKNRVLMLRT